MERSIKRQKDGALFSDMQQSPPYTNPHMKLTLQVLHQHNAGRYCRPINTLIVRKQQSEISRLERALIDVVQALIAGESLPSLS